MDIRKYSNGLRLVYQYFDTPLSYCGVVVGSGSRHELKNQWGVAHLAEHMLFKGTVRRSYIDMLNYIEGVGGELNAYTSKEDMCIYVSLLNGYFSRAVDVLSDVTFNSVFEDGDIEKEKGVIVDEINSYLDSPSEAIADDFDDYLFPDSLLGRNILGSEQSVSALSKADLEEYYVRNYCLDNIVFSYAGGLLFDEVEALVVEFFKCERKSVLLTEPVIPASPFFKSEKKGTFQAHCIYGKPSVGCFDDDRLYYMFLNSLLGGVSFNSLLNLKLREENGLTYNIDSAYSAYADIGMFTVYFGTDYSKVNKCLDIMKTLFTGLCNEPLSLDAFNARKTQFLGQVALHFDGFLSVMLSNGKSLSQYDEVDSYEVICDKVRQLDYDTFVRVSRSLLDVDTFSTLIYR